GGVLEALIPGTGVSRCGDKEDAPLGRPPDRPLEGGAADGRTEADVGDLDTRLDAPGQPVDQSRERARAALVEDPDGEELRSGSDAVDAPCDPRRRYRPGDVGPVPVLVGEPLAQGGVASADPLPEIGVIDV